MTGNYLNQLNRAYEDQTKLMEQSDGSKLHRPSDSPVGYSKYLRYTDSSAENAQYQENVNTALSWMKTTDTALVNVTNILQTFKEKTTAAANGTNNESDMDAIAKEMLAELQEVVSDMNVQIGDRYVFSGQSDLLQPFNFSENKIDRGLPKTLDNNQMSYFNDADTANNISQMLTLQGDDGNEYYLNTLTGNVYSAEFVNKGYKDKITAGQKAVASGDEVGSVSGWGGSTDVSKYFDGSGVINSAGTSFTSSITVGGKNVNLTFKTIKQYVVTYNGDDKYISMTKKNGAQDQSSDTVNLTGKDVFASNIFDDANSGNESSACAVINDLLAVQAQTDAANHDWLGMDGMTLSDNAHATVVNSESKLAARQNVYTNVQKMLTAQDEIITGDITTVSATDVAQLAVRMMEAQMVYNMSLSVGGKILPPSLADYIS